MHTPARLPRRRSGEAQASAAAERFGLRDRHDLRAQTGELRLEQGVLPRPAADDDPVDAGAHELRYLVLGERMSCDRHERLRLSACGVAETRRLAAGEDDRFH